MRLKNPFSDADFSMGSNSALALLMLFFSLTIIFSPNFCRLPNDQTGSWPRPATSSNPSSVHGLHASAASCVDHTLTLHFSSHLVPPSLEGERTMATTSSLIRLDDSISCFSLDTGWNIICAKFNLDPSESWKKSRVRRSTSIISNSVGMRPVVAALEEVAAAAAAAAAAVPSLSSIARCLRMGSDAMVAVAAGSHEGRDTLALASASLITTTAVLLCTLDRRQLQQQSQSSSRTALTRVPRIGVTLQTLQKTPW